MLIYNKTFIVITNPAITEVKVLLNKPLSSKIH